MAKAPRTLITGALDDLDKPELDKFTALLLERREDDLKPERFKKAQVNNKSTLQLADRLVGSFGPAAVSITVTLLKAIDEHAVANDLEKEAKEHGILQPNSGGASGSTAHNKPDVTTERPSSSRDSLSSARQRDAKDVLTSVRADFVKNVSEPVLDQLLDHLLQEKVLNPLEMESVKEKPRADKARDIVDAVIKKSSRAASILIEEFCELDPSSELCDRLRSSF